MLALTPRLKRVRLGSTCVGLSLALLMLTPAARADTFVTAPGSPFPLGGTTPLSMVTADFNGDGRPDLATGNVSSGDVSVLLGTGNGAFASSAGSPFRPMGKPRAVAVGDFNGDGQADLVTANPSTVLGSVDDASVLLGDGAGGFALAPGSPFSAGPDPASVAVGDFNGDSRSDVAFTNTPPTAAHTVSVRLGDGAGGFGTAPGSPFPAGTQPESVVVADFDEDGRADLAVGNRGSEDVSILLGDGAGGFSAAAGSPILLFPPHGLPAASLAVGDLNEDGHTDLAVGNFSAQTVSVLLGDGSGRFAEAVGSPVAVGGRDNAGVAVGDFNADGHADLALPNRGTDNVSILLGAGTGRFTPAPGSPFPASDPGSVVAADFNGDGRDDVTAANVASSDVTVLLSAPNQAPVARANGPYETFEGGGATTSSLGSSDSNGDSLTYSWDLDGDGSFETPGERAHFSAAFRDGPDSQTVILRVCDHLNACDTDETTIGILNRQPEFSPGPDAMIHSGQSHTVDVSFTDTGLLDTHTATIDWGEGAGPESVAVTQGAGFGNVGASHQYLAPGTYSISVCITDDDGGGGCVTSRLEVLGDVIAPTITLTTPAEQAVYVLNQAVVADYRCEDEAGGSGLASCAGTVANGAAIDTASVGPKTFTVTAADNAGNTNSITHHYSVVYDFSGFLAPVNNPNTVNTGKTGRTYPVKWQLRDANGTFVSALSAVAEVLVKSTSCAGFTNDPTDALETSTTGSSGLRYDSGSNQYVYNWASPTTPGCYTLFLKLDSGQVIPAYFQLS